MQSTKPSPASPNRTAYWAALVAAAASITPAHADTRTVSWFLSHDQERRQVMAACLDDPGDAKVTPNCDNAAEASFRVPAHTRMPPVPSDAELCTMMPPAFKKVNHCR